MCAPENCAHFDILYVKFGPMLKKLLHFLHIFALAHFFTKVDGGNLNDLWLVVIFYLHLVNFLSSTIAYAYIL